MGKTVATLILNRNLGKITDALMEHLQKFDGDVTDIYVIESGSEREKCSKYPGFRAEWEDAVQNGLRYGRGFNFGLSCLLNDKKYDQYDYYFLVWNNSIFFNVPTIALLLEEMASYSKMGVLSPCDSAWGEDRIIPNGETRIFWYGTHVAWLIRRSFIDSVRELENPNHINFLYDGTNFRGYYLDVELIGKAYANDFSYAVTKKVCFKEIRNYKEIYRDAMHTDATPVNQEKMLKEGMSWLRRKYGFQNHWYMLRYVKNFYDLFLENNPEYLRFKV